jgi:hydrogenase nickel incorporation protein HypA/HybF
MNPVWYPGSQDRKSMHELSVTESILEIALRHAKTAQAKKIDDIYLVIGQLSSIIDDSVQFYWEFVSKDTPAQGAQLHFRRIPAEFRCTECGQTYPLIQGELGCPSCGSANVKVSAGEEFYLEAIEVET